MKNGGALSKPWREVSGLNGWQPSLEYMTLKSLLFSVVDKTAHVWQQEMYFQCCGAHLFTLKYKNSVRVVSSMRTHN